jgi:hypothetical protein
MTSNQLRRQRLMPGGIPRYVRCYDNGGPDAPDGSCDRYTVVFTGRAAKSKGIGWQPDQWPYLAMSGSPFHPQGFGQHGHTNHQPCDTLTHNPKRPYGWPPAIGRRNHLGTRIRFQDLPPDCRKLVLRDYKEIWRL